MHFLVRHFKVSAFFIIIILFQTTAFAQYRNGYKTEGVTVAGGNGNGNGTNQLSFIYEDKHGKGYLYSGIWVDNKSNVYVADRQNNRIQKWQPGATDGETVYNCRCAGIFGNNKGDLYITCGDSFIEYNLISGVAVNYGSAGEKSNNFSYPQGIFVDQNDIVYVADCFNFRVQKWYDGLQKSETAAGGNGLGDSRRKFNNPIALFVDSQQNIFVSDEYNGRVQKWAPGAKEGVTVAGGKHSADASNQLDFPEGIYVDKAGNVFVADQDNNRIQEWPPGATEGITVAGGNGMGNAANQLDHPTGLCADNQGNLYVVDNGNNRVQKFEKEQPNIVPPQPTPNNVVVVNPAPLNPVKPEPAPVSFTSFSWIGPVADFSALPDGAYHTPAPSAPIKIKITANSAIDVSNIQLKLNGNTIAAGGKTHLVNLKQLNQPLSSGPSDYIYTTTVDLQKGNNTIQLVYHNSASDALPVIYQPESLNLYLLSIGTKSNLQYPQKDAIDFADMFNKQGAINKYFNAIHAETLTGDDAKAGSIVDKVADLAKKDFNRNDVLLIFISSHGGVMNNSYRIMGSDFETTKIEKTTVNFEAEILEPLKGLNCKKFIFLDACYSGSSLSNQKFNGNKAAVDLDISREIGRMVNASDSITIITSSSGTQQSWEDPAWQNGAFTKALKEAMQEGKADTNGNGIIDMDELYAYIRRRVPELVKQAQKTDVNNTPVTQQPEIKNPKGNVSIYVY